MIEVAGARGRHGRVAACVGLGKVAALDRNTLDELGYALDEEDRERERDQKLRRPLREAAVVGGLFVLLI